MNEERATALAVKIVGRTTRRGTTSTHELIALLMSWEDVEAAENAVAVLCDTWQNSQRPTHGQIIALYREAQRLNLARKQDARYKAACDGTRWNQGVPCPRCNPYLHDVWQDPDLWGRFLDGTPLHVVHPDVRLVNHRLEVDVPVPAACLQEDNYDEQGNAVKFHITSGEALAAAAAGFAEGAAERGIEPDWERFDRTFRALIASVTKENEEGEDDDPIEPQGN